MGNETSNISKKIQDKFYPDPVEPEINIGMPTNVVRLNKDEILKMLEEQNSVRDGTHLNQMEKSIHQESKQKSFLSDVRQSTSNSATKTSEVDEAFQIYVKEEKKPSIIRIPSFKRQNRQNSVQTDEVNSIGTPTDIVHVRGFEVVKLVEEQHVNGTNTDENLCKLIEEAKETPKILFKPDSFDEASVQKLIPLKIKNGEKTPPTPPTRSSRSNTSNLETPTRDKSPMTSVQNLIKGLETIKALKNSRISKSEAQTLVITMHEALDVLLTSYLVAVKEDE